jgi:hypothetical protein
MPTKFRRLEPQAQGIAEGARRNYLNILRSRIPLPASAQERAKLEDCLYVEECTDGQFDYLLEDVEDYGRDLALACYAARKDWIKRAEAVLGRRFGMVKP